MRRTKSLLLLAVGLGCATRPAPAGPLELVRRGDPIALADPSDPIGVTASGLAVARLVVGADTGFRLVDSSGAIGARVATPGVGVWVADGAGGLATMMPGAAGAAVIGDDGAVRRSIPFKEPGILRGVWGDSVDVVRLLADGFKVLRVAADGSGERELVGSTTPNVTEMLGIGQSGTKVIRPDAALPSVTTTPSQVAIGNGSRYRVMMFDAAGARRGEITRQLPVGHPTARQIERELAQLRQAQGLTEQYLSGMRAQIAASEVPFFTPQQGVRFDGAGRLWVVGYEADSAFADIFSDTTFVKRTPLACPGFDGSWDLAGEWLVVGCGRRDGPGGELIRYRIKAN